MHYDAQQLQPQRTTTWNRGGQWGIGKKQGDDSNQEHANDGIAAGEDWGSNIQIYMIDLFTYNYFICTGAYWITY